MKLHGIEFTTRNANKKYQVLDDLDNLYALLLQGSMQDVAKSLGVPHGSVWFMVNRYFTQEMRDLIKKDRRFHKRRVKLR
jgi:hypothetical protein